MFASGKVAVELVQFVEPEIKTGEVVVRWIIGHTTEVADVLHEEPWAWRDSSEARVV